MAKIRILVLMTAFSLLSSTYCSAVAILYVNINNPTPGAGTSWATAFNDLNAALTLASTGGTYYNCQIWVAKGTYTPTSTTDRTISFLIRGVVNVYGGFAGTETSLAARNWTTNPTILSGDIGVSGDATDNSYNVVTINNNFSDAILDGFTVQDGNGNQNYPATTTLQTYNQAGGILIIAPTNVYTGAIIDHCIIQSNFGVYGGGACTYANGSSAIIEVEFLHDLFQNNTSVMGGGLAWVSTGGGNGLTDAESCIFVGNSSPASGGSAIAVAVDGSASKAGMEIDNSTFYNNAAPLLNNLLTNGGASNFYTNDCIMWQAAGPYSGALSAGANTHIENCDLDVATPSAGNTNNDPEFVDAAAGNFHLQPCSPDIDLGGEPVLNSPVDYDGNPRIQNNNIDWGAYESSKTVSPIIAAIPANYCQNSTAVALTAPGGTGLLWYTAATGGTGSTVAPIPSTATVGSTQYWVTQTQTGACESGRTRVTITIKGLPTAPMAVSPTYCENASPVALAATGSDLLWYTSSTGGTGTIIAPTPSTTADGVFTYYVTQTDFNHCESLRTPVTVTVNAAPAAPTVVSPTYCENAAAVALTATGSDLLWYTVATGGSGSSVAPVPSTAVNGVVTYYVSQTNGCESPRAPVTVTVNAAPAAPTALSPTYCENATAVALTATGSDLLWYTAATGGVGSAIAPVPSTAVNGVVTYYVSQTNGCESPRVPLTVTVNAAPAAPTALSPTYCENATAVALTATGADLLWYTAATGGVGSVVAPVPSTAVNGVVTYYVSQTSGCESPRVPLTVTVNAAPAAPTALSPTYCENATAVALTATGADLLWYTAATGGVGSAVAPVPSTAVNGVVTYYVSQTSGCESPRVPLTVTVNALPQVAIDPVAGALCNGKSVTLLASGASSYQWSPSTGLSDPAIANPAAELQGDISYVVTGTDANGCTATASITLQPNSCSLAYYIPNAFTPNGDGQNDVFRVKTSDVPRSFSMLVFNRLGEKVFESADIAGGWDGGFAGGQAQTGAYVYVIAITNSAGNIVKYKGTIALMR